MTISNRSLSESRLTQDIDLGELLGRAPTSSEMREFEVELLEVIIGRTQDGIDVDGDKFTKYNPAYAEKKGVGVSDVDLTLMGDMLLAMETQRRGNSVRIQIDGDEAAKAYGHVSGFKGHPYIKDGPKRDFFGITDEEARTLANKVDQGGEESLDLGSLFATVAAANIARQEQDVLQRVLNNIGLNADSGGLFG
jgi:Holliday junction resolvase